MRTEVLALAAVLAGGNLSGRATLGERVPAPGEVAVGFVLDAGVTPLAAGATGHRFAAGPRAEWGLSPSSSAWFGVALERREGIGEVVKSGLTSPLLDTGVRTRRGAFTLAAGARHVRRHRPQDPVLMWSWTSPPGFHAPPDTFPTLPYWQDRPPAPASVTAIELAAGWSSRRWSLEASGGVAAGRLFAPATLARVQAVHWIGREIGISLGVRTAGSAWIAEDFDERRRVELGVRVAPGRLPAPTPAPPDEAAPRDEPRWEAVRLAAGEYALRARVDVAEHVAVRGDFTSWEPLALARTDSGWWEIRVRLAPGVHRVELSIDGGDWHPPPGALTGRGEYGEVVGMLVAE